MKHLFVDISSHGYGHFAQTAPVLNALMANRPLRLTIRSGLPQTQLARRLHHPFTHIHEATDFGFIMQDALNVDLAASAERYRSAYADWPQRVSDEAQMLTALQPDLVLSNVSPLPLAGAAKAGIPALAMCSLNWADLFQHYYAGQAWAEPIHTAMLAAYGSANAFLRFTPGMDMPALENLQPISPVSLYTDQPARTTRQQAVRALKLPLDKRWLLIALGGIAHRLPVEDWPELPDTQFLVPAGWQVNARAHITPYNEAQLPFAELLPLADIVLSKPGYGTFVEAACCGLPVLYLQRGDWPEAACLESWLYQHARAAVLPPAAATSGELNPTLTSLLEQSVPPKPVADGATQALHVINGLLDEGGRMKT